ncbi:hypothetical protein X777_02382 [Ooceraea biroi]|uniref:Uncharacterized protein n=1 Tax=Ooceraea biroi TaxID=2015173 RepID=A0A026VSM6_OOCBI|nr:hypothetical protein X777_02382 [Ooceraea biroi]
MKHGNNRIDSFQDAILVKDVGVSCSLLNENVIDSNIPISGVESYLIRQLKLEYNELSSITRKINAYTKDILSNLATRCKRKDQALQKLENPCLKLRFCNDTKPKYRSSKLNLNDDRCKKETDKKKKYDAYLLIRDRNREKHRVELDKAFLKEVLELPPKGSGVLLHNYLIMKKEKVSGNASKMSLRKVGNFVSPDAQKNHNVNKSFCTTKCDPLVFTNWREVSRRKNCKFTRAFTVGTSGKSRCTVAPDSHSV